MNTLFVYKHFYNDRIFYVSMAEKKKDKPFTGWGVKVPMSEFAKGMMMLNRQEEKKEGEKDG